MATSNYDRWFYYFFSPEFGETFPRRSGTWQKAAQKFVIPAQVATVAELKNQLNILDVYCGLGYDSAALGMAWAVSPLCRVELFALEMDGTVPKSVLNFLDRYPVLAKNNLITLAQ